MLSFSEIVSFKMTFEFHSNFTDQYYDWPSLSLDLEQETSVEYKVLLIQLLGKCQFQNNIRFLYFDRPSSSLDLDFKIPWNQIMSIYTLSFSEMVSL